MQICKVVGTCVATIKEPKLEGLKMLVVQPVSPTGAPQGAPVVAIDSVGAGIDEIVLIASGSSARQTELTLNKPVDTVIMAIVDSLTIQDQTVYKKWSN